MREDEKFLKHYHHAKQRAKERYGLRINVSDYEAVVAAINSGRSAWIKAPNDCNHAEIHDVFVKGIKCRVVFSRSGNDILTFLPWTFYDNVITLNDLNFKHPYRR